MYSEHTQPVSVARFSTSGNYIASGGNVVDTCLLVREEKMNEWNAERRTMNNEKEAERLACEVVAFSREENSCEVPEAHALTTCVITFGESSW